MNELSLSPHAIESIPMTLDTKLPLESWIEQTWGAPFGALLAHAYDGVIWALIQQGRMQRAEIRPGDPWPELRWETLLDLRVFAEPGELRIWRSGPGKLEAAQVRQIDGSGFAGFLDQEYWLLGDQHDERGLFTVRRGRRGECHAAPRGAEKVKVRHSFERDPETGLLREAEHRWLGLRDHEGRPFEEK